MTAVPSANGDPGAPIFSKEHAQQSARLLPFFLRQYAASGERVSLESGWLTAAADEIDRLRAATKCSCGENARLPTCGAAWRDTESPSTTWFCQRDIGHSGHHQCIGATW